MSGVVQAGGLTLRRLGLTLAALAAVGCSKKPPPDFAPAPALVSRIRTIEISTPSSYACPGQVIPATYVAVLNDGGRIPFARTYDKDRPPQLHVVFLDRWSEQARPHDTGDWVASANPLLSISTGFHLQVSMKQNPAVRASVVLSPSYECMQHAFRFVGPTGKTGETGGDGPDVVVRLGIVRSPFYDRLIVAGIEVNNGAPHWVFADANLVAPRDWLVVEARGGKGGRGETGSQGRKGQSGQPGCPGGRGGRGWDGGAGGRGGQGGRGGRITIIAPHEDPFLAGIVEVRTPGGEGGDGGEGGEGGDGGDGGEARALVSSERGVVCQKGPKGPDGEAGPSGDEGRDGHRGPRPQVLTVSAPEVFGTRAPPELADLLWPAAERR